VVPTDELEGYGRRSRGRRALLASLAVAAIGAGAYLALKPAEEKPVPDFALPRLQGGSLSSEDLKGSPLVVNFFASWCAPCREEAPVLEAAWKRYRDDGVRFLGVNVQDTEGDARRFVRDYGITYPVVRDAERTFAQGLAVYGLPQTFFIDDEWRLLDVGAGDRLRESSGGRVVTLGAISEKELDDHIGRLLRASEASTVQSGRVT
jgi:cytochrome c biogenesis protein CcmG, thiol:disulfide interchange protein DsbE